MRNRAGNKNKPNQTAEKGDRTETERKRRIYEINHVFKICEYVSFRLMRSTVDI